MDISFSDFVRPYMFIHVGDERFFVIMSRCDGHDPLRNLRSGEFVDSPMVEQAIVCSLASPWSDVENYVIRRLTYSFMLSLHEALGWSVRYLGEDEDVTKWRYLDNFRGNGNLRPRYYSVFRTNLGFR